MRGEKDRHEAFQEEELQQETRPVGACFIECYQAAIHKGEMERKITHTKKIAC